MVSSACGEKKKLSHERAASSQGDPLFMHYTARASNPRDPEAASTFEYHFRSLFSEFQHLQKKNSELAELVREHSELHEDVLSVADYIEDKDLREDALTAANCLRLELTDADLDFRADAFTDAIGESMYENGHTAELLTAANCLRQELTDPDFCFQLDSKASEVMHENGENGVDEEQAAGIHAAEPNANLEAQNSDTNGEGPKEGHAHELRDPQQGEHLHLLLDAKDDDDDFHINFNARTCCVNFIQYVPDIVIMLNALTIGLSADLSPGHPAWDAIEFFFFGVYLLEFLFRVSHQGLIGYFFGPNQNWNIFDFVVLCIGIVDTLVFFIFAVVLRHQGGIDLGSLAVIKVCRLVRVVRLVRTLKFKFFDDLKLLLSGVVSGLRVLVCAVILLLVLIYALGVIMRNVNNLNGNREKELANVPSAMFTLFRCFTDGCTAYDGTPFAERVRKYLGGSFFIGYILVYMLVTVGVFNLIMGIFIDNVMSSQSVRKMKELHDQQLRTELLLKEKVILYMSTDAEDFPSERLSEYFHQALRSLRRGSRNPAAKQQQILESAWSSLCSQDLTVTRDQFVSWLNRPEFLTILSDASIDVASKGELFDIIDADMGGELSMHELLEGLMSLRGHVTKNDIICMLLKIRHLTKMVEQISSRTIRLSQID
eukprot:TRINITY_DN43790_c0_g1_i1.p1 TRINITY_DN43790_c0_g1~~TRINITY_DN43790_c0_g1_i1.p1  ORF type:complete len:657 (-),score=102.31 TRINITY_DN43790_c0_g1_i1:45-2015(-)